MKTPTRLVSLLLVAALGLPLAGCVEMAVVGAGAGALMVSDRRMSEVYVADEGIEIRAAKALNEKYGDRVHVNVTSYNRTVLLTGEVADADTRDAVEKVVTSASSEVRRISNELIIGGATSYSARSNDVYLTSKVKARFLDASKFFIGHVKVVTENGVVYLLGIVTQREADAAVEIARTTGGVQRVVRVFEIITEDQAKAMDGRSNAKK